MVPEEEFGVEGRLVWRRVSVGEFKGPRLGVSASIRGSSQDSYRSAWDQAWLRGAVPATLERSRFHGTFRIVDLFSGCGAMTLGARMAAESLGLRFEVNVAADFEPAALDVYERNFKPRHVMRGDISAAVEFELSGAGAWTKRPRLLDAGLRRAIGVTDLLIGGPPCQGHSDLNNHSRRNDPKNSLYLAMPAVAVALDVPVLIIENVPAVVHDRQGVVERTRLALEQAGYRVSQAVCPVAQLGVAQRRKRHALVAVKGRPVDLPAALAALATQERALSWAIEDLKDEEGDNVFDSASALTRENRDRIETLFSQGIFDLPNDVRPACHRDKEHSYVSMYGRMKWKEPAQTITSGYGSPGQGRYIHPCRRRTITPHEAARVQFFPDSYRFGDERSMPRRTQLAVMIGNAVPPKLSYAMTLAAFGSVAHLRMGGAVGFRQAQSAVRRVKEPASAHPRIS